MTNATTLWLCVLLLLRFPVTQEDGSDSDSDGLGADLDEDGDVELRLARLEHLLERRPILVRLHYLSIAVGVYGPLFVSRLIRNVAWVWRFMWASRVEIMFFCVCSSYGSRVIAKPFQ